jgi:rare lipoprotein A
MRLPDERAWILATLVSLGMAVGAAPALAKHKSKAASADSSELSPVSATGNSPASDFPVVIGEPYTVADTTFTPSDAMNFDAVGYASVTDGGGGEISAANHTLPIPSYIEVTSLDSGRTILVRVDHRGPMTSTNLVELSAGAAAQLGVASDGHAAVRVRRVNPPESERAVLRAGGPAPERLATPKALLAVLGRKLTPDGSVLLARLAAPAAAPAAVPAADRGAPLPGRMASGTALPKLLAHGGGAIPRGPAGTDQTPRMTAQGAAHGTQRTALLSSGDALPRYALRTDAPPPTRTALPRTAMAPVASGTTYPTFVAPPSPAEMATAQPKPARAVSRQRVARTAPARPAPTGDQGIVAEAPVVATADAVRSNLLVVQAGAFGVRANAQSVAVRIGARVSGNGNVWRVRMGPFASRDAAEAALAKAHAAGYSTARIQRAD